MGPGHACSAETEGKTSPVFHAKLLASMVLLGSCIQRKTVRTCSSTCFSDRQAPCCDMAAPVVVPPVAVCVCLARLLAVLDGLAFGRFSAIPPSNGSRANPCTHATFFSPFDSFLAPLAPHRRSVFVVPLSFLTFLFVLYNLQHTGSAFHSFKAIHHTHFCCLLLPFSLPRSFHVRLRHLLDSSSHSKIDYTFIHFAAQASQNFTLQE
jgi:hypothetical protein